MDHWPISSFQCGSFLDFCYDPQDTFCLSIHDKLQFRLLEIMRNMSEILRNHEKTVFSP